MKQEEIIVQFPDGKEQNYQKGVSLADVAGSISSSLKKKAVGAKVNGAPMDLSHHLQEDASIEFYDLQANAGVEVMRHSAAHILAQAVKRIYGNVHFGVGPVIENGFYYDVELEKTLAASELLAIEKEMKKIASENIMIKREEVSRDEAKEIFAKDPLKLELLQDIPSEEVVTVYRQGEFVDLCRGPHLPSTKFLKAFKLTHVSGAYWRGDSNNKVLQRIYGVAFSSQAELEEYFHFLEEAHKRNHRKLGNELELFMFSEEAPGMPFYLANGQIIRNELESFLRGIQHSFDYQEVRTPLMMNQRLWEQSGHWDHYKENMYFSDVDDQRFALKPMNCPGHMLVFKNKLHSYRELPIRMAEFGQVHRHEFSGALNGLLRVRSFCQDDAHLFVRPDQIEDEIMSVLKLIDDVYSTFGFDYDIELSTRPEDYMGEEALWDQAEGALKQVLSKRGVAYRVNEGGGAFYGPKIDIHIKDALKRSHQCATVQLDFQMPEKFDLTYVDEQNNKVRPVIIHRAVFGSIDRFLGILIEHYAGAFPVWLAPVQVKVIAVSNEVHQQYAESVKDRFKGAGIRVELDLREEKLGYKIREAQMKKVPFILVVGDKEMENQSVHVRRYGEQESEAVDVEVFLSNIKQVIAGRVLNEE
ncbi:threonine--tRNA ligase [Aquibacillus koreensis]|uniref:Threonine--tRNA ligase n=1 Tax=Aquibacillus koreensis TaxID=279446 RepID=A0A9X4AH67_9BACI|nr:threonine--tRNA ligase [Aquibacillus koreensis]MCT2536518.1 threonine--tRNA ligase [Aquibacillus koreensis]MDC3419394.1 threonine--tRNA ligase [Aquibacillus koreensis]